MLPATQPPLADRARWAVALYNDSYETEKEAAYQRDRHAGIRRYKNAPAARLRADLEPVLRAYSDGTIQHSAAAYVLARYGVDTERNAARLFRSGRMDRAGSGWDGNAESLPTALGDLWVVRRSAIALRLLLTMPSDGAVSEIQEDEIARALKVDPDAALRTAVRSPKAWQALAASVPVALFSDRRIHERSLLAKLRRDAKRYE